MANDTVSGNVRPDVVIAEPRCKALEHQFFVVEKNPNAAAPGSCWAFTMCVKCGYSRIVKPDPLTR